MALSTAQRVHLRINKFIVRVFGVALLVVVFYQLWAVMGWYACIGSTAFDEHTRVTQECMDGWMSPIDDTVALVFSTK